MVPDSLKTQAQAWRSTFRTSPAARIGLYSDDRLAFAAALLAAWAEGKQVVLPGDVLPATQEALRPHVDVLVGNFPGQDVLTPGTPTEAPWPAFDREAQGVVVFTSGSTGAPTAIPKRLRQLFDEVAALEATFGSRFGPNTLLFSTVSHQHIYGLLCSVLWPLLTGRPLTARRIEYPEELEQVLSPDPCVLISSPAHLKRLPDGHPWATKLAAVFSSGGPLPPEGADKSRAILGLQPIELYGSSETGGIAWRQGSKDAWQTLPGVEFRQSAQGMLELRSPYLADAAWFATADRIEVHGTDFTLLGRGDRIAKIEEKRVSLELIERAASSSGLLIDARVVLLDGPRITVGLVGILSDAGRALSRKEVIEGLKTALQPKVERVAWPRRFRFVDELPLNAQGKVTEASLAVLFGPERPPVTWLSRTAEQAFLELSIPSNLRVLDGHFPVAAVVPGVAQVDWAIAWGREVFPAGNRLQRMDALKFQALLRPGDRVKVQLDWNAAKSMLSFKFSSDNAAYSSGRVVLSS